MLSILLTQPMRDQKHLMGELRFIKIGDILEFEIRKATELKEPILSLYPLPKEAFGPQYEINRNKDRMMALPNGGFFSEL